MSKPKPSTKTTLPGLATALQARGLSAQDLARAADVNYNMVANLVSCRKGASLAMALRLGAVLGVSVESLSKTPVGVTAPTPRPRGWPAGKPRGPRPARAKAAV